jgi:Protein of unknown function (DUF3047)
VANSKTFRYFAIFGVTLGLGVAAAGIFVWSRLPTTLNPLIAKGEQQLVAMDFSVPFSLDHLPPGWSHYKFLTRPAMELTFVEKDGVRALRCETHGGGSIFGRAALIDLKDYAKLSWRWFVETPIASDIDERTSAGDDQPVRFFLGFEDPKGASYNAEIIWGNKRLQRGDWKVLEGIPHYVADGGSANIGQWRNEEADLVDIYRKASGRTDFGKLTQLAIFCDSDDTGGHTVAYVGPRVVLLK